MSLPVITTTLSLRASKGGGWKRSGIATNAKGGRKAQKSTCLSTYDVVDADIAVSYMKINCITIVIAFEQRLRCQCERSVVPLRAPQSLYRCERTAVANKPYQTTDHHV